jgi:hypothetical protein
MNPDTNDRTSATGIRKVNIKEEYMAQYERQLSGELSEIAKFIVFRNM